MIKAVILAAGRGERLSPLTNVKPKSLLRISGKPIIERIIDVLKHVGINCCVVVTGYKAQAIQNLLGDGSRFDIEVHYSHNPTYHNGNAVSLKTAQRFLEDEESFLLLMADHLIDRSIVEKALENVHHAPLLCVDWKPRYSPQIKDATKVLVDEGNFIRDIGKDIPLWNAVDTGVFLLNGRIFQIIEDEMRNAVSPLTLSRCLRRMISAGLSLWACDVSGCLWLDIDTFEDLMFAERVFGGFKCLRDGTA